MAINVATLTARLDADHSRFSRGLKGAGQDLDRFEKKSSGVFKRFGGAMATAAKVGGAAAVAAIGFVGVKAVTSFASFEKQMNDVFTLLPDISQDAMDAMSDQVLTLSRDFGVLPEETVPALYQALSAGVPPDNVFAFMETATKAAIGGSVDLETAVDGVTSTMNAFADSGLTAAEASDIMFTTVRLGKTTMDELSKSLFQVSPIAAGLGVDFGDVGASLAALTAQGVPTRVATTQVRQALVELSKGGTKASKVFEEMSGKTFVDFIAEGGNMQEAFELMKDRADDLGVGVSDLFGSIEAGAAVLTLTSEGGAAAFTKALDEMDSSAGATEAAFKTMDKGLSRSWDKIKATAITALIKIGNKLAPFIQKAADWLAEKLPGFIDTAIEAFENIGPIIGKVAGWLGTTIPKVIKTLTKAWERIAPVVERVFGVVRSVIETVVGWFSTDATSGVEGAASGWMKAFQSIVEVVGPIFTQIVGIIGSTVDLIAAVSRTVWKIITAIWEKHGKRILNFITTIFKAVAQIIEGVMKVIRGIIDVVTGIITGDWEKAWGGIKTIISGVWDVIQGIFDTALELIQTGLVLAWDGIKAVITGVWNAIVTFISAQWETIKTAVSDAVEAVRANIAEKLTAAKDKIGEVLGTIVGFFAEKFTAAKSKVIEIMDGIKTAIGNRIEAARVFVSNKLAAIVTLFRDKFQEAINWVRTKLDQIKGIILGIVGDAFNWAKDIGKAIVDGILDGLKNLASAVGGAIGGALSSIPGAGIVKNVVGAVGGLIDSGTTPDRTVSGTFGFAHGGIVTSPTLALIGEAGPEAVVPLTGRGIGGFGGGLTVIVEGSLFGAASVEELVEILEAARRNHDLRGGALIS